MRSRTTAASKRASATSTPQAGCAKPIGSSQKVAAFVVAAADSTLIDANLANADNAADAASVADAVLRCLEDDIANDNERSLELFYDATVSRVYGVALRIVRVPQLAEEVISEVYMQVWRDAARYDKARGLVLGWLLIIARTRAVDLLRRQHKQDEAFSHPTPHDLVHEPESPRDIPEDLLDAAQINRKLYQALALLPPLQRQLLSLAFFRGLTHVEIVAHTAFPLGSVKTHIRRALLILRDALGESLPNN